ncbi:MAG TPA: hypothetical protein VLG92_02895 [Candidatus Saccharimonadia bacterium]|nr:hypothetical protein [Candidatus Saccharimonadia bacterium]
MTTMDIREEELREALDYRSTGGDAGFIDALYRRGHSVETIRRVLGTVNSYDSDYSDEELIADLFDSHRALKDRVDRHDIMFAEIFRRLDDKVSKRTWAVSIMGWAVMTVLLFLLDWPGTNAAAHIIQVVFGFGVFCFVIYAGSRNTERSSDNRNRWTRSRNRSRGSRSAHPAPRPAAVRPPSRPGSDTDRPDRSRGSARSGVLPRVGGEPRTSLDDLLEGSHVDEYPVDDVHEEIEARRTDPNVGNAFAHLGPESGVVGSTPVGSGRPAAVRPPSRPGSDTGGSRPTRSPADDVFFNQDED